MDSTAAEEMAAYDYVRSQSSSAADVSGYSLVYDQEALRDAFMAGAKWQRDHPESKPVT